MNTRIIRVVGVVLSAGLAMVLEVSLMYGVLAQFFEGPVAEAVGGADSRVRNTYLIHLALWFSSVAVVTAALGVLVGRRNGPAGGLLFGSIAVSIGWAAAAMTGSWLQNPPTTPPSAGR